MSIGCVGSVECKIDAKLSMWCCLHVIATIEQLVVYHTYSRARFMEKHATNSTKYLGEFGGSKGDEIWRVHSSNINEFLKVLNSSEKFCEVCGILEVDHAKLSCATSLCDGTTAR